MSKIEERAYAKLNLTLDILGKREDGYHDLRSVMQQITLCDDIEIEVGSGEDWKIVCNWEELPTDSRNLAWKAAMVFYRELGRDPQGVSIRITKRIPAEAGLGGGSADAACVLKALNHLEGEPFTVEQLMMLGEKLGSDVPFCVLGGTALAEGRGERLTKLPDMPDCFYCIVMPDFSVSTARLFAKVDQVGAYLRPNTEGMLEALEKQDLMHVAGHVKNIMEPLVVEEYQQMLHIRAVLEDCGALGVSMTGSGSAIYGIFDAFDMAAMASMELMEKYKTFLSRNVAEEA